MAHFVNKCLEGLQYPAEPEKGKADQSHSRTNEEHYPTGPIQGLGFRDCAFRFVIYPGHLVFLNHSTTGDGILTALRLLTVMVRENKSLAELAGFMEEYPQVLVNLKVKEKKDLATLPQARKALHEAEQHLGPRGRLLVRYSGTEAKLRIMAEGENQQKIEQVAQELARTLDALLN